MRRSTTVFFVPIWFDEYTPFAADVERMNRWDVIPAEEVAPRYLLNYASRIATDKSLFSSYRLRDADSLPIYMYGDELGEDVVPEITEVRLSCFFTGVGFLEFRVVHDGLSLDGIADFSYLFKKASKKNGDSPSLCEVAKTLVPDGSAKLFFTDSAPFKYECICYHFIHSDLNELSYDDLQTYLTLLKRNYNTSFYAHPADSEYDMFYSPYPYDHWAGSPEGLVNISFDTGDDATDYYLRNYKPGHLSVDYYFMFLLLLNQRFSAIQYILKIAEGDNCSHKDMDKLNRRIVRLKTVFSFTVISGDHIFQNVYSRMYRIMDIDRLLEDIRDNENQMEIIQNAGAARADRLSSRFLFGISLLSLFSALIDASSYFDRFERLQPFATALGLACTALVTVICCVWIIGNRKR